MKKVYEPPVLDLELYVLDSNIASNCAIVVTNGPIMDGHEGCEDYVDPFSMRIDPDAGIQAAHNVQFYDDQTCDCYYSATDAGHWTS